MLIIEASEIRGKGLSNKDFLLAQVFFCKKKKCIEVRGMFCDVAAKGKGFIIEGCR